MSEDLIGFVDTSVVATARFLRCGTGEYSRAGSVRKSYVELATITRGSQASSAEIRRQRMKTSFVAYRRVRLYMVTGVAVMCEFRVHLRANCGKLHKRIHCSLRCS
jgi:hypothetical protein